MFKRLVFFFVALAGALIGVAPVFCQSASLVEAGKKAGKAVVYGSLEPDSAGAIFAEFKKKTGIEAEYWRASDADKIQFVEMYDLDSKKFAEKKKEYQQIFLR